MPTLHDSRARASTLPHTRDHCSRGHCVAVLHLSLLLCAEGLGGFCVGYLRGAQVWASEIFQTVVLNLKGGTFQLFLFIVKMHMVLCTTPFSHAARGQHGCQPGTEFLALYRPTGRDVKQQLKRRHVLRCKAHRREIGGS